MSGRITHGTTAIRTAIQARGLDALDKRSAAYREMAAFRDSLIEDLGGEQSLSTQQLALIDLASRAWLMLSHVDSWLLSQDSILTGRGKQKRLLPVMKERGELARHLESLLARLGLERRQKDVTDLRTYLARRYGTGEDGGVEGERGEPGNVGTPAETEAPKHQ